MSITIATLLTLFGLLLNAPLAAGQSIYCAFEVTVHTPSGTPVGNVPVVMILGNRTTFSEATTAANGIARLCDAPLETVDIVVGFDVCGSVLVRSLKAKWPEIQAVNVTYVNVPCDHLGIATTCQVLLRVQDDGGRPVSDARFSGEPAGAAGSDTSDALGRLFRSVRKRVKVKGVISKDGWEPSRISVACLDDVELKVVLHKK